MTKRQHLILCNNRT